MQVETAPNHGVHGSRLVSVHCLVFYGRLTPPSRVMVQEACIDDVYIRRRFRYGPEMPEKNVPIRCDQSPTSWG